MTYEETEAVRSIVASVAHHIDAKQWSALQALYASEVETDYTSLFGGTPQSQSNEALVAGWRGILTRVRTQHLLGPITVTSTGAIATARCHVRALHQVENLPGGDEWEVLGHYVFELARQDRGWRIRRMKLETFAQTGNRNLIAEATK
jgi:hypothetical protein